MASTGEGGLQKDSSCPTERSPLGVEARDEPLSMLSEPELWCCCSEPTLDVMVDEDVDEERVFSLKSVMITVTLPTVMASCCAVLRSMFFSLGLEASGKEQVSRPAGSERRRGGAGPGRARPRPRGDAATVRTESESGCLE